VWSSTLRDESRLRVIENMVLRRIFGSRRGGVGVTEDFDVDFYDLYFSSNIIRIIKSRRMGWAGQVARLGNRLIQCYGGEAMVNSLRTT
jgi:hypothetical protein